jgi:hypothetical protein
VLSSSNAERVYQHKTTEYASVNRSQYQFISRYEDINTVCYLILNALLEAEVWHVGLDCEWGVVYNAGGFIIGQNRLALIQIGYKLEEQYSARIFQVTTYTTISPLLEALILDSWFTFCGCNIGGDIAKIFTTYKKEKKM